MHYFARHIPGTLYTRYYLGHTRAGVFCVTAVQISRPDGHEIAEPARWADHRARQRQADPGKQRGGVPAFYARGAIGIVDELAKARARGTDNSKRRYRITKEAAHD
jgi:hypothetical protein